MTEPQKFKVHLNCHPCFHVHHRYAGSWDAADVRIYEGKIWCTDCLDDEPNLDRTKTRPVTMEDIEL